MRHRLALAQLSIVLPIALSVYACGSTEDSTFGRGDGDAGSSGSSGSSGGSSSGFGSSGSSGGADGGLEQCATATAEAKRTPVYMLVVIDGSGSMDFSPTESDPRDGNKQHGTKWIAVREALIAFVDQQAATPDNSFGVGLYLFSSTQTKSASAVDVPIKVVDAAHASTLKARILPPSLPSGGTPLLDAMTGQMPILKAFAPTAPLEANGKRVLVVMTDGVPDGGATSQNACKDLADTAFKSTPQITTFAVGVGNPTAASTDYDEVFMGTLAVAGGAPATGCKPGWNQSSPATDKPCHFQITPGTKTAAQIRDEFLAAINAIRNSVTSCEFTLEKPPGGGEIDPGKVNVVYTDGSGKESTLSKDPNNGWSYDNDAAPTKVTLNGPACNTLKADPKGKITIVLGCKTKGAN